MTGLEIVLDIDTLEIFEVIDHDAEPDSVTDSEMDLDADLLIDSEMDPELKPEDFILDRKFDYAYLPKIISIALVNNILLCDSS